MHNEITILFFCLSYSFEFSLLQLRYLKKKLSLSFTWCQRKKNKLERITYTQNFTFWPTQNSSQFKRNECARNGVETSYNQVVICSPNFNCPCGFYCRCNVAFGFPLRLSAIRFVVECLWADIIVHANRHTHALTHTQAICKMIQIALFVSCCHCHNVHANIQRKNGLQKRKIG